MEKYKQVVGDFGEEIARQYLVGKNYLILGTKVKSSYQEIDIIAQYQEKIVFVEVKTRTTSEFSEAEETINRDKLNNLKKAMQELVTVYNYDTDNARGDLILVRIDKIRKIANIKHYKDVF